MSGTSSNLQPGEAKRSQREPSLFDSSDLLCPLTVASGILGVGGVFPARLSKSVLRPKKSQAKINAILLRFRLQRKRLTIISKP